MTPSRQFVQLLQALPVQENIFNPWRDQDLLHDAGAHSPLIRSHNLERYLDMRAGRAKLLFVGEAPGYQGCHFSGIAMTSERILLGAKEGVPASAVFEGDKVRTSRADLYPQGANEPTATIAWSLLLGMGLAPEDFLFWNALPTHPHKPGALLTNRAPKPAELAAASHVLPAMLNLFPEARVIAVGRVAQKTLHGLGHAVPNVRHPAMGGASAFRQQVQALLA